ncbi:glucose dehydrogenase [FAD, quinone]-like [Brevipalpus obovatus]|uniref:glucose dehydrogenase [FAD, quinone]-like n=1 Tax=Brevipalpus obovatus TaxID=246614 RepID=UPI003D9F38A3
MCNLSTAPARWSTKNQRERLCGWGLKDNRVSATVGHALGGGSAHNEMIFIRGNPLDFNRWEQLGANGWSWADVFPYYLKLERITQKGAGFFDEGYHGTDGPISIQGIPSPSVISRVLMESIRFLGLPIGDLNGKDQSRFSYTPQNNEGGQRCSSGRAYLSSASVRKNLHIVINAVVQRIPINFPNKRAEGVEYKKDGKLYHVKAKKEVILSAGTFNFPKLLMLSGIGPRKQLEKLQIPVILDLPGVGQNLHDHPSISLFYTTKPNTSTVYIRTDQLVSDAKIYSVNRTGPFSVGGSQIKAFTRSKYALDERPDMGYSIYGSLSGSVFSYPISEYLNNYKPQVTKKYFLPQSYKDGFTIRAVTYRPLSRGTLQLASKNVEDEPIIHLRLFSNEHDLKVIVEACKLAAQIAESKVVQEGLNAKPFPNTLPKCEKYSQGSDSYFRCLAQTLTRTGYHHVGTCKMGSKDDQMAVVDPHLRVRGIKNLRVIDASVMPEITTGNTNAPAMMIGERDADLIRGRKLEPLLPPVKNVKTALKYKLIDL